MKGGGVQFLEAKLVKQESLTRPMRGWKSVPWLSPVSMGPLMMFSWRESPLQAWDIH